MKPAVTQTKTQTKTHGLYRSRPSSHRPMQHKIVTPNVPRQNRKMQSRLLCIVSATQAHVQADQDSTMQAALDRAATHDNKHKQYTSTPNTHTHTHTQHIGHIHMRAGCSLADPAVRRRLPLPWPPSGPSLVQCLVNS